MILKNLYIIGNNDEPKSIIIDNSAIQKICNENEIKSNAQKIIDFENSVVFPGLINSHDHLEFNLFPPLGNKKYENYIEWGEDIHRNNKDQIESVLKIPVELRYKWGIFKNLFSGVTTVFQHGKIIKDSDRLVDVYNGGKIIHSVKLEKYWRLKINLPGFEKVVIHIAEGNDNSSKEEIKTLIKWNFLKKKIIGIHAVALEKENAKYFDAIIWCPVSNYFLYNKTANISELKEETKILFGTDSRVSAEGNIWEHLRLARKIKALDDNDLFHSITSTPAEVWNLKSLGLINENYLADLVIAKNKFKNRWDSFFSLTPEDFIMILKKGRIIFWDESIKDQLNFSVEEIKLFSRIAFNGNVKYVLGNISELVSSIRRYNSEISFPFHT